MQGGPAAITPGDIVGTDADVLVFNLSSAPDPVHVVVLGDGGLISYKKETGLFIHTLCDSAGFSRKLENLGIRI